MEAVAVICEQHNVSVGRFQRIRNTEEMPWRHKFLKYNNFSYSEPND